MISVKNVMTFSFVALCLLFVGYNKAVSFTELISEHVDEHTHTSYVHDNIDDNHHVHGHKHSEDGEEHEHHHSHQKVPNTEILTRLDISFFQLLSFDHQESESFFYIDHQTSSFVLELLRPPIS